MADVKLCKDCKWCQPKKRAGILFAWLDYSYAKCAHESTSRRETEYLVAGQPQVFCSIWRGDQEGRCGPEGKHWEAR